MLYLVELLALLRIETKKLMSLAKSGTKNPLFGGRSSVAIKHTHSNETWQLMRDKKIGTKLSEATKKKTYCS